MMFIWLILIGVLIYFLLVKPGKRDDNQAKSAEDPVELLKKRFINGEITEEEYNKMRKIIND
jgi:putative membrane protein